jgi:hypothetical protein
LGGWEWLELDRRFSLMSSAVVKGLLILSRVAGWIHQHKEKKKINHRLHPAVTVIRQAKEEGGTLKTSGGLASQPAAL